MSFKKKKKRIQKNQQKYWPGRQTHEHTDKKYIRTIKGKYGAMSIDPTLTRAPKVRINIPALN
jgi:hypothetical protein